MNEINGIVDIKEYGKVRVTIKEMMEKRSVTRNKLRSLTGVKYEVIDRYYKAQNIERVDLDFLAKVCFVLNCSISDLLIYEK